MEADTGAVADMEPVMIPPAPLLVTAYGNNPCPMTAMRVDVDCHMSEAIVTIAGTWQNMSTSSEDLRLDLPLHPRCTVCCVRVKTTDEQRVVTVYDTAVVPMEQVKKVRQANKQSMYVKQDPTAGFQAYVCVVLCILYLDPKYISFANTSGSSIITC